MGIQDLQKLFDIKEWIRDFNIINKTDFNFIVDSDTQKASRLLIDQDGNNRFLRTISKPQAENLRNQGFMMFVPDLIDIKNKLIIEYQEDAKPGKKGHDELSDMDKDLYYQLGGFRQLKLWEQWDTGTQKKQLFSFLSE